MIECVKNRDIVGIGKLVEMGVSMDKKDDGGNAPLHVAVDYGYTDVVEM